MKNHFNINKLLIVVFSFICFFMVSDGVKAVTYEENPKACNDTYTKVCNYASITDIVESSASSSMPVTGIPGMEAYDMVAETYNQVNSSSSNAYNFKLLTLHYNLENVCFDGEVINSFSSFGLKTVFIPRNFAGDGECPKKIYVLKSFTDGWADISLQQPNVSGIGITLETYGLLVTMDDEEIKESDKCETVPYIKNIYNIIRFLVPVIIIVLSVIDFAGVVISGEDDKMEKAKKKFVIRIIVGIVILFIPIILELILKIAGILESNEKLYDIACLK